MWLQRRLQRRPLRLPATRKNMKVAKDTEYLRFSAGVSWSLLEGRQLIVKKRYRCMLGFVFSEFSPRQPLQSRYKAQREADCFMQWTSRCASQVNCPPMWVSLAQLPTLGCCVKILRFFTV